MNNENKYPVQYAVLELKEKGGYLVGYKDIIRGNIVSKCYVVESSIKYSSDGNKQIFHKVVFPFKSLETLKLSLRNNSEYIGEKAAPGYDANNEPYPVDIVSDVFDTYEEANVKAQERNEKMKQLSVSDDETKRVLTEYEKDFMGQLSICKLFERLALAKTEDMNITHELEEDIKLELLK